MNDLKEINERKISDPANAMKNIQWNYLFNGGSVRCIRLVVYCKRNRNVKGMKNVSNSYKMFYRKINNIRSKVAVIYLVGLNFSITTTAVFIATSAFFLALQAN